MQLESLKDQVGMLERERKKLHADLQAAWAAAEDGKMAQKRAVNAGIEVAELRRKHEVEERRRRQAEIELDKIRLITARDHLAQPVPLVQSK